MLGELGPHCPKSATIDWSLSACPFRMSFWICRTCARESHCPYDHAYVCQAQVIFPSLKRRLMGP